MSQLNQIPESLSDWSHQQIIQLVQSSAVCFLTAFFSFSFFLCLHTRWQRVSKTPVDGVIALLLSHRSCHVSCCIIFRIRAMDWLLFLRQQLISSIVTRDSSHLPCLFFVCLFHLKLPVSQEFHHF